MTFWFCANQINVSRGHHFVIAVHFLEGPELFHVDLFLPLGEGGSEFSCPPEQRFKQVVTGSPACPVRNTTYTRRLAPRKGRSAIQNDNPLRGSDELNRLVSFQMGNS